MRAIVIFVVIQISLLNLVCGQGETQAIPNDKLPNSVFVNIKSGKYAGTANGVLFFKNQEGNRVILDFQGSQSELTIIEDKDEVYDVSTKKYIAYTTSGKTKIDYQTYGLGNELNIQYNNQFFRLGSLDGASDMVINGLSYYYIVEKETEYLILQVTKELKLTNYYSLLEKINYDQSKIDKEVIEKEQFIFLQPKSVLVFAIKRN